MIMTTAAFGRCTASGAPSGGDIAAPSLAVHAGDMARHFFFFTTTTDTFFTTFFSVQLPLAEWGTISSWINDFLMWGGVESRLTTAP